MLESKEPSGIYSVYASDDPEKLIRLIAHEQFHVYQRQLGTVAEGVDRRSEWEAPTALEVAALLNEVHFLAEADVSDAESLVCAKASHAARITVVQTATNDLLTRITKMEGSAEFVEAMYSARGNIVSAGRKLGEFQELLLTGEQFDWPNRVTLFGYYLGAKANLLTTGLDASKKTLPLPLEDLLEMLPAGACTRPSPYKADSMIVQTVLKDARTVRENAIARFFESDAFYFIAMNGSAFTYATRGRVNIPGGVLIWGDPVVQQPDGTRIAMDRPLVLLHCRNEEWNGVLVSGDGAAFRSAKRVSPERARQLVFKERGWCQ